MRLVLLLTLILFLVGCSKTTAPVDDKADPDKSRYGYAISSEQGGDPDGVGIDYFQEGMIPITEWLDLPDNTLIYYYDAQSRVKTTTWGNIKGGFIDG